MTDTTPLSREQINEWRVELTALPQFRLWPLGIDALCDMALRAASAEADARRYQWMWDCSGGDRDELLAWLIDRAYGCQVPILTLQTRDPEKIIDAAMNKP